MRLTLVTAAAAAPVDLVSAKHHCRVDHDEDDVMIQSFIDAATAHLDGPSGILGRVLMPQSWQLDLKEWPSSITLPVEPIREIAVQYRDTQGSEVALASTDYVLSGYQFEAQKFSFAESAVAPLLDNIDYPVSITIEAGYADADSVPAPLKTAILMLVAHWYQTREAVIVGTIAGQTPLAFDALIAPYRRFV